MAQSVLGVTCSVFLYSGAAVQPPTGVAVAGRSNGYVQPNNCVVLGWQTAAGLEPNVRRCFHRGC